jgi:hypothetical protein
MKYLGLTMFLALCKFSFSAAQEIDSSRLTFRLSSGISKNTLKDYLLNYYTYSGYAWRTFKIDCSFGHRKNYFLLSFLYHNSKLDAKQLNTLFYDYNYVNQWNGEFRLEYYRTIWKLNPRFSIHIGATNHAYFTILREDFKNTLYDYATSFRKSYDVSAINLSPLVSITYYSAKHKFRIHSGYTLINLASRPDDNFVKQIDQNSSMHWKFYSLRNYVNYQVAAYYQYQLFNNVGVSLEYMLQYRAYTISSDFKYLQRCLFLGITKSF